jgi:WD40 repeat protein
VKVWSVRSAASQAAVSGGGAINAAPVAEFYDHESAITCAAIHDQGLYAAAGAEDGLLVIWNLSTFATVFSRVVSTNKRLPFFQFFFYH